MFDILKVCCILLEVLLDLGVEGVGRGDHLGGMVTDLSKVLQCLWGEGGEGRKRERGGRGGNVGVHEVKGVYGYHTHTHTHT